jgi:hypothetical protein
MLHQKQKQGRAMQNEWADLSTTPFRLKLLLSLTFYATFN